MLLEVKEKKLFIGDKEVSIKVGEYALQANGSIILQCGETLVQAIACMGGDNPDLDFFPLTVEYNENLYAGGIIKSHKFSKREGRPSDEAILKARIIDRSIRPMFPKDFRREVQVIINILSSDKKNPHDVLGLTAAIAALAVSDIPFDCHIGGIRLSKIDGKIVVNPTYLEADKQDFELVLAGNENKIVMIECAAECVADAEIEEGFAQSFSHLGVIAKFMDELQAECGKPKLTFSVKEISEEIYNRVKDLALTKIEEFYVGLANKTIKRREFDKVVNEAILATFTEEELKEKYPKKDIIETIDKIFKKFLRENILKNKRRVDGRGLEEVREIQININPIPRVHGSSMFMRGETQVLNILTLGAPGNEQLAESIEGETIKRYIHHYNAPPYSVGEVGRYGGTGRREIGHGALAEKALRPVVPPQSVFPYVMRVVSEVMGQNGSSSMASTCASTVSLMAGGVPIKEPVAGISIGLITAENENEFITLTDIMGFEDFGGDMDFKVAGTKETITAIQMDTKIKGLTFEIIKQSLKQAKEARNKILNIMLSVIDKPMADISVHAPRIESIQIPSDTIGKVVGQGGKVIRQISSDYNVEISIDESGMVSISGLDKANIDRVKKIVKGIVSDPVVGEIYPGKIVRITDFGAFVEIFPGKEGLLHISKISKEHVNKVSDILSLNQIVDVKLMEIDYQGRLNFSMILDEEAKERKEVSSRPPFDKRRR
ncbi:MAG: polyribonucleotide nucleotidyltransferase [Spirochaetes bacterium GWD1_27_9]|nr:MAG: polyribonucleotide nucleotidyltransferase [Spirochaetes bacterium GWB1_27_13]OHD27813.1 MAG: polyribonucleotide nucleotidyltransferase [Spirochaetes bacterium GWC1_27_15]OHD33011.1 MAG: polyribonucleotide nucleotidyltransferase [Spirochaetes bacterium GWD1_27_9]